MYWDDVARRVGIPVSATPQAGSIAVRNSGRFGHVAFVTKVHSNGSFEVDEYNFGGTSRYSHRTTRVGTGSAYFDAFIHFT
jgi:surface antigen